jgi:lactate dehydrogenase-like 2-hydroxyacid dehydrogenase
MADMTKIAILDDYIGVALEYGDWSALPGDAEVTVYREAIAPERLTEELRGYEVVIVTPHIGYVTEELFRASWPRMAEDVTAYLAGAPIRVVTDPADCPPMAPQ